VSRTRPTQRAWKGDVAGYRVRGGKPPSGRERGFPGFLKGGGYRSASQSGEKRPAGSPLPVRSPKKGSGYIGYQGDIRTTQRRGLGDQGEGYTGNIKLRRYLKGGGSVSGKVWNNKGTPIQGRTPGPGVDRMAGFQGNIRAGKRVFNNQGEEYTGNIRTNRRRGMMNQGEEYTGDIRQDRRRGLRDQGEEYTGNIKARRPLKSAGSISGKLWNNNNKPIPGRTPGVGSNQISRYQGNIKAGRRTFTNQGEEYTGNIKAHRPLKGGGSVSGKLWNNREKPLAGKDFSSQSARVSGFSGNIKAKRPEKGGGSVSGVLWNNGEKPIEGRAPKVRLGDDYTGNLKVSRRYSKNPNSADEALKGIRPTSATAKAAMHSRGIRRTWEYDENPNSANGALKGIKPTAASVKAGEFSRGIRRTWDYVRNPSSAKESRDVREPGKAFARSTDYQGNIKMRKFELFGKKRGLHPDSKFVKLNKNNVAEEKDMFTNFKLWWARLFKKSDTQPDHLKEKERKPRYDKGESGMWYE
jgi:hypothetical protein